MAFIKIFIGIIITLLLNILCENNMSIISWIIISVPFMLMTIIAVFILFTLGLNPATGKSNSSTSTSSPTTTSMTTSSTVQPTTTTSSTLPPTTTTSSTVPPTTTTSSPTTTPDPSSVLTTNSTPSQINTQSNIPPPSIYANPLAVNYHGVLANNVRAIQSNFS